MRDTIYGLFRQSAALNADRPALLHKDAGTYTGLSYAQLDECVSTLSSGLQALGIGRGDSVGILSCNRPEWVMADLAALSLGAIVVPVYHDLPASVLRYLLTDSGVRMVFVENADLLRLVMSIRPHLAALKNIVVFDAAGAVGVDGQVVLRIEGIKDLGRRARRTEGEHATQDKARPEDVATVVYTSGTTGRPKGVQLSHANIVSNALAVLERFRINSTDVLLSYLPLCHMFERTCGYYAAIFSGAAIGYAESFATAADDASLVRPTVALAVPRVLEKAYSTVRERMESGPRLRRLLAVWAIRSANRYVNLKYRRQRIPLLLQAMRPVYDALVLASFRKVGGGRLRLIVCGGAPLDRQIAKILLVVGFELVEGYGLTEAAPVVSCGSPGGHRLGTVGEPLQGVQVRIGGNGEILVRGPNVMKGYLNRPEETQTAIDEGGWLHTGDLGEFDDRGNLVITGRIKELIVTSYGKNISPTVVESQMLKSGYIDQVVVCGEGRRFVSALVVPNRESLVAYAQAHAIPCGDYAALLRREEVKELVGSEIERLSNDLAPYERIKAFALLPDSFSMENGLLTHTLKLRRRNILERYRHEIENLYAARKP